MGKIVGEWVSTEPFASLLVIVAAGLLLGHFFRREQVDSDRFAPWFERLVAALARAAAFVGIVLALGFLLRTGYQAFEEIHGSFTQQGTEAWSAWRETNRDRAGIIQEELRVQHFIETMVVETIAPVAPAAPPLYRNITQIEQVLQNSIVAFRGQVDLSLVWPEGRFPDERQFNTFLAVAHFEYVVQNGLDIPTQARYHFPVVPPPAVYEDVHVSLNGMDIDNLTQVRDGGIEWTIEMAPGQTDTVVIDYRVQGVELYVYTVPEPRELQDFLFTMTSLNVDHCCRVTVPDVISYAHAREGEAYVHTWEIGNAIMAPSMGLIYSQGRVYAPYDLTLRLIVNAPRVIVLSLALIVLTLLICGERIRLADLVLLGTAFALPFLMVMGLSIFLPQYEVVFGLSVVVAMLLTFLIIRKHSWLAKITILIWVLFLIGIYPFTGVFESFMMDVSKRNSFESIVHACMIAYLFGMALYAIFRRIKRRVAV